MDVQITDNKYKFAFSSLYSIPKPTSLVLKIIKIVFTDFTHNVRDNIVSFINKTNVSQNKAFFCYNENT